jgi:hypothetical protein
MDMLNTSTASGFVVVTTGHAADVLRAAGADLKPWSQGDRGFSPIRMR